MVFRTVDIGGDKAVPYLSSDSGAADENPAMGWRALRLALERDGLFKAQARALIEAAGGRTLRVMFPMISEPWEFDAARAVFEEQREFLRARKRIILPEEIEYGAMIEVPGLVEVLDLLVPKVSFLSVGTNDLTQFLFAADRANPKLAARYDWLSPAILRFLKRIVDATAGHQVRLGLCGEMGGRRLEALALLGLGYRRLSITPVSVGPIKELIRQIDLDEVSSFMSRLIAQPPPDTRAAIAQWAQEHGIEVE